MKSRRKNNTIVRLIFNPRTFAVVTLAIIVYIAIPISKNIGKSYIIDQEIIELEEEISDLKDGNKNFEKIIEYLESDQFVEEQARLSLGLKKKGEEVVVVGDAGQVAGISDRQEDIKKQGQGSLNPVNWWRYFFKIKRQ